MERSAASTTSSARDMKISSKATVKPLGRRIISAAVLSLSLCSAAVSAAETNKQSLFLKEIVTGRCFDKPPSGKASDDGRCPVIVGELVGVWQSHLDEDITPESYSSYMETADFNSPPDTAVFGNMPFANAMGFVTVEDTPGGALLKDLVFCGVNLQQNCDAGSNAHAAFWAAAQKKFASQAQGRVRVFIGEDNNTELLDVLLNNTDSDGAKTIELYHIGDDASCDTSVLQVDDSLSITCFPSWVDYFTSQQPEKDSTNSAECDCDCPPLDMSDNETGKDEAEKPLKVAKTGGTFKFLFWMVFVVVLLGIGWVYYTGKSVGKYERLQDIISK